MGRQSKQYFYHPRCLRCDRKGQSGVLIRGEQVARTLLESSENLFLLAANIPVLKDSVKLSSHLENLKKIDSAKTDKEDG